MVLTFADNRNPRSLASQLRAKRLEWFKSLVTDLPRPLEILDVGGNDERIWETVKFADRSDIHITIINLEPLQTSYDNISALVGDATDMQQFQTNQFDVVYSNSVIEHIGDMTRMRRMAQELRRVGRRYFVQTPNRYFPIEPHFVFPFFQFLPRAAQIALVQNFKLGWVDRRPDKVAAQREVDGIRLLSQNEMRELFPDANLRKEVVFGLAKSLIAYKM